MATDIDLDYDLTTLLEPLDLDQVREFEEWWHNSGYPFKLEKSYLEHLSVFHGGKPKKRCFLTKAGRERMLDRFLNFIKDYKKASLGVYHVEVMRCLVEDRLNEFLLPFATLFGGDLLCFDYSAKTRPPSVIVWLHEESASAGKPVTEPVASQFTEFLGMLYESAKAKTKKKK